MSSPLIELGSVFTISTHEIRQEDQCEFVSLVLLAAFHSITDGLVQRMETILSGL